MISLRHCGIYVHDINKMELFYENVFQMHYICRQEICCGKEFDILVGSDNTKILMSKLITEKGKVTGSGDMIELLQVIVPEQTNKSITKRLIEQGTIHIAMECQFDKTLSLVKKYNGSVVIRPIVMKSGNKMCIVTDPEGNYIELIERMESL